MLPELSGSSNRTPLWLWLAAGLFALVIALVVFSSVSRPETPVFTPSSLEAREVAERLLGPDTVTLDARHDDRWTRFDLGRGTVAAPGEPWDIAVKRYRLAVNGGSGFAGAGGVLRLDRPFDEVTRAPVDGYEGSRVSGGGDTVNAVLDGWYGYSLFSHLLEPKPGTFVVRTHDGRYAKLAILGYYCPGPAAGCLTFEYAYQGDGSRRLAP